MSNFEKAFMRPNLANIGTVPAKGTLSSCPDIWISGTSPLADYQAVLASEEKYATECSCGVTAGMSNYIYVRAKNGGTENITRNVSLYYAQSDAIQWPSRWKDNRIGTDISPTGKAMLNNMAPGEIKVCDRPFVWTNTPKPNNSTHFCLIAQINDDANSNPFPDVSSALDMADLVANNLQWGWRNIQTFDSGSKIECSYTINLTVPADMSDDICEFSCEIAPKNLSGFQVGFSCSQPDSKGNPIFLDKTNIVQDSGQILGCRCFLKPGYNALVTVYLYNDNKKSVPSGAIFPFEPFLVTTNQILKKTGLLHLSTPETQFRERMLLARDNEYSASNWGIRALVKMGGYSGLFV